MVSQHEKDRKMNYLYVREKSSGKKQILNSDYQKCSFVHSQVLICNWILYQRKSYLLGSQTLVMKIVVKYESWWKSNLKMLRLYTYILNTFTTFQGV